MVILGIDPGIATVGFGAIRTERNTHQMLQFGVISTPAGQRLSARLLQIAFDLEQLIDLFRPDAIAVEELFFNTNVKTAISVAHGRGVILMTAEKCGIPLFEYTPLQVKQAVVGYGRAEKMQVMKMTQRLLGLDKLPRPDDAADALAVALCHSRAASSLLQKARQSGGIG